MSSPTSADARPRTAARGRHRTWLALAVVLGVALATGGCAERQLVTHPSTRPGGGTWIVVWTAGALAAGVLGVLLTLPAWRLREGARFAVTLLTAQAGAITVAAAALVGVAIRTAQLLDRPADASPAVALLRLSRIDGDRDLLSLMVLLLVVGAALLTALTALSARFAAGDDVLERSTACAVLGVELGCCGYAVVRLLLGARGLPYVAGALAFPLLAIAIATCWPRRS